MIRRYLVDRGVGVELVIAGGPGVVHAPHTHVSTVTFLLIRKGVVSLFEDGRWREITKSGTAVIAPHRPHSLRADGRYELLAICADVSWFRPQGAARNLVDFGRVLAGMVGQGVLGRSERKTLLALFAAASSPPAETDDAVSRLKNALVRDPEREISLADMADAFHVGKSHLIRKFKHRFGLTPRGFLNQSRLRKAKREYLGAGSLTQAALRAGFYDQSHFIRYFKRYHGITPRQYLRCRRVSG